MNLIEEVKRAPFIGTGKPEFLKHTLKNIWSRRIDQEQRLVYRLEGQPIKILARRITTKVFIFKILTFYHF